MYEKIEQVSAKANVLKSEYFCYEYVGETKVVRNKYYSELDRIYNELYQNGFEFTRHDIIKNDSQKKSYERKVLRIKSLGKRKKLKFLYHYRDNENRDLELIIIKAEFFLRY